MVVNPNIATVQTSKGLADKVYFLPVNGFFVEKVIKKEKPNGILLGFGGQTALNCGLELWKKGILKKYKVRVYGTPVESIKKTEDRELFKKELEKIGVKVPSSVAAKSVGKALGAGRKLGFPLILRSGFSLGGQGSGIVWNEPQLKEKARLALSSAHQILIEEYLKGWKEIEYEVVRDKKGNCVTVCNMENVDPMGVHTGESIVVAPSQTLSNAEYHLLREISIKVVKHLRIVGECNVQFALNPKSLEYRVIEVNARLSRSSALASKATGYPLAFIAAKLALGKTLNELRNSITKKTSAFFEPSLDYVVVKIPKWDLQKFRKVSFEIGSEMKSVGEVMAIGRSFEEALQKGIRMLGNGLNGLTGNRLELENGPEKGIKTPNDKRLFYIGKALEKGKSVEKIHKMSFIDKWFLFKMKNIVETAKKLRKEKIERSLLRKAKEQGFSDKQIGALAGWEEERVREKRKKLGIVPVVKQIDTLSAEFPAKTNYLYSTYNGSEDDVGRVGKKTAMVLGSGAYSIGSSVEFDWCCVNAVKTARRLGYKTVMVNFNPETVSTDFDECDSLYFEELSMERVRDIYGKERPIGIILSVGGQIPNTLAVECKKHGLRVLGTSAEDIDRAEDRHKFSALLDKLGVDQPEWVEARNLKEALEFSEKVGYPVLVRPSYVLSGSAMNIAFNSRNLKSYLKKATSLSRERPVVVSKFIEGAKEIEIDAVAEKGKMLLWAITEHVENAGVHSGDATMVLPAQKLYIETMRRVKEISREVSAALHINGPFNIQFIAKSNEIKVIECNLRSSRSFPFVSKVFGVNFIEFATKAMLGEKVKEPGKSVLEHDCVGVKAPQFSFSRLKGADPVLGVEMASTGEVGCLGSGLNDAFLKSIISTGFSLPKKKVLLSIGGEENRYELLPAIRKLKEKGFELFATQHTSLFLKEQGIENTLVFKLHELKKPNARELIEKRGAELVVCVQDKFYQEAIEDEYLLRRLAVDYGIPLITNRQLAKLFINAVLEKKQGQLEIKSWNEYIS